MRVVSTDILLFVVVVVIVVVSIVLSLVLVVVVVARAALAWPWHVLCDNEKFLDAKDSQAAYTARGVVLWHVPPRSPDLNPVEQFWGWLRKELRRRDLRDALAKRPPLGKSAYLKRVRAVICTRKAQTVAGNIARSFKKTCREVVRKGGAAARG